MSDTPTNPTAPTDVNRATKGNRARKKALSGVAAAVLLAGMGYGVYWALVLNHFESTDNAYVQGHVVQITPQLAGTVKAIAADDTDHVKAGQWLVRLDPADAQIALEQAQAALAQTVREVRTLYANNKTQQAQIALRSADLARAHSELARLQDDVSRRQPLLASGAVGREEFDHVSAQLSAAISSVAAAREQLAASQSLTEGTAPEQHPSVLRAAAKLREALLALQRTELVAPVDGYVARRNAQLGQRVPAGAPLMSVIALNAVWVEANFKESQLKRLRLGQPVELSADVYGKQVLYHGRIEGMGAGTGAAFALLPAQNATGNWIKVVQRVPVRIQLDRAEVAAHPLRVGLSMDARVDVSQTDGPVLAAARGTDPTRAARAPDRRAADADADADALVQRIIAANLGPASRRSVSPGASSAPAAAGSAGLTPAQPALAD